MRFPTYRARRLRESTALRRLVQETRLAPSEFVLPLFVVPGHGIRQEISSMPGQYHLSVDQTVEEARSVVDHDIPAVLLFGLPEVKDPLGQEAYSPMGAVQQAVRALKQHLRQPADREPDADGVVGPVFEGHQRADRGIRPYRVSPIPAPDVRVTDIPTSGLAADFEVDRTWR